MTALPGLIPQDTRQFPTPEFGTIRSTSGATAMVELDAPRFRGRLFGPYLLPTFTVSSADHSHTVTPAGTRCVVFFNGGNLAEAAVFPVGA